jgi:hypothetical protein
LAYSQLVVFSRAFTTYYILGLMVRKAVPRLAYGIVVAIERSNMAGLFPRGWDFSQHFFFCMSDLISLAVAYNFELSSRKAFEKEPARWNWASLTKRRS